MLGIIATPLGWLLTMIYGLVNNYGVALIILTVIVRLCLVPMYANQLKTSAKMADLQPKIQEIQKKYVKDKETMGEKLSELYKKENYNPMSGCLPMLIQFPIIMGLFALLRAPMTYLNTEMIMAVHESFFWVLDLSQPDSWILPIAAGLAQYFAFSTQSASMDQNSAGMMNTMKYFFPVMIFLMGRSFPAGLTLYWFVGTLVMIVQNFIMKDYKEKIKSGTDKKKKKEMVRA